MQLKLAETLSLMFFVAVAESTSRLEQRTLRQELIILVLTNLSDVLNSTCFFYMDCGMLLKGRSKYWSNMLLLVLAGLEEHEVSVGSIVLFLVLAGSESMKYPQLVSMPSAVQDWLDEQLEARGIDAVVYTRYILSLLQRDTLDLPDDFLSVSSNKVRVRNVKVYWCYYGRGNDVVACLQHCVAGLVIKRGACCVFLEVCSICCNHSHQ